MDPDKLSRSQRSGDPARGFPAKPKSRFIGELNIDPPAAERMKICGIARAAQALAPRVALSFLFKSIELLKYSICLCHKPCSNMV
jgi:hypothetical protein